MKNLFLIIFMLFNSIYNYSQNKISSDVNDTLSVNNFGKSIYEETNLQKSEKLNEYLLSTIKARINLKTVNPKAKKYYQLALISASLSQAYFEQVKANYKKSISINLYALKESNKIKNNSFACFAKMAIAFNFLCLEEYDKALKYYKESEILAKYNKEKAALGYIYAHIGTINYKNKNYNNSLKYNFKSLEIRRKLNDISKIGYTLNNIGENYLAMNQLSDAEKNFKGAEKFSLKANDTKQLSDNYLNLGNLYLLKKESIKALDYLLLSNKLGNESKNLEIIKESSLKLYNVYNDKSQYKLALKFLEESLNAEKKLNKDQNKNELLKAEFKYETEKKEAQIKALSQQKKIANLESQRQKTIAIILTIAIISLLITTYFVFNRYKIKKQNELLKAQLIEAEKTIEAEKKATESELKALKSQMNPHFIFNALSSIQDQFMYGDKVIANEQMGNFTQLTRQILNVSGKKQILLSTEIDILSKYLELEKMRFKTDFDYIITIGTTIDEDYHEIPPMLIQPFVENSIKHGLLHKNGLKKVSIDFKLSDKEDYIICTVEDNGIGRKKSQEIKTNNKHNSFSTESIAQRLQLLNNNDDNVIYEDLKDENGNGIGTRVIVKIYL